MANYLPYGQIGMPTAYTMGGGTIGGPNVWDWSTGRPQLSASARSVGTVALPSGALGRQEVRNRSDVRQMMESGRPYVEAPSMFQLNQSGMYVDPITGKSMGTMAINYSAGGWRGRNDEEMTTGGGYGPRTQEWRSDRGLNPYAPRKSQSAYVPSPFPQQTMTNLTGFGGIPRFPFSGY